MTRPERFKEAVNSVMSFNVTDVEKDAFSGVHSVSFRIPNSQSIPSNTFEYHNIEDFIIDMKIMDPASPAERIDEFSVKLLEQLGINKDMPFSLEVH